MASGITHERAILVSSPFIATVGLGFTHSIEFSCSLLAGYLLGIFLSPDLDLETKTLSERRMEKAWIFGKAISAWATIYAKIINNGHRPFVHRGISHWPVIGTLTRWLWFGLPLILVGLVISLVGFGFDPGSALFWLIVFIGHCLSDLLHFILDCL